MTCRECKHEALVKQRRHVEAFRKALAGRHDGNIDLAGLEQSRQLAGDPLDELKLNPLVTPVEIGQQAGEPAWADGAHDADFQVRVSEAEEARRFAAHPTEFVEHLLEARPEQRAEIGNVGQVALAPEQQAANLVLQLLDGATERRLGDIALLGGPREVAGFANSQEIADVMNVHAAPQTSLIDLG